MSMKNDPWKTGREGWRFAGEAAFGMPWTATAGTLPGHRSYSLDSTKIHGYDTGVSGSGPGASDLRVCHGCSHRLGIPTVGRKERTAWQKRC